MDWSLPALGVEFVVEASRGAVVVAFDLGGSRSRWPRAVLDRVKSPYKTTHLCC